VVCVSAQSGPQLDTSSISGTVVNAATGKPEAGVWVIADTKLGVPYRKIVVTDDQGRFLVPDLPPASYGMWVRGYGLKNSTKTHSVPPESSGELTGIGYQVSGVVQVSGDKYLFADSWTTADT
jgi:Carboxypeptidase regulatory-like domain